MLPIQRQLLKLKPIQRNQKNEAKKEEKNKDENKEASKKEDSTVKKAETKEKVAPTSFKSTKGVAKKDDSKTIAKEKCKIICYNILRVAHVSSV